MRGLQADVRSIFREMDVDNSGKISFNEMRVQMVRKPGGGSHRSRSNASARATHSSKAESKAEAAAAAGSA